MYAYSLGRLHRPSVGVRCPSAVRRPQSSNISSETVGPVKAKFDIELHWDGGRKVCSNDPGQVTRMAAMPIYGKTLSQIFFSKTFKLGIQH